MNIDPLTRWTRPEAAEHLRCSISSVIRYESEGLESHRVGPRLIRFWATDVIAFKNTSKLERKKKAGK